MIFLLAPALSLLLHAPNEALALISLHNPTSCANRTVVEIPTGDIAAPGVLDWSQVRLSCDGEDIPFTLRSGAPVWREAPGPVPAPPRPSDLLVFTIAVPPGQVATLTVTASSPAPASPPVPEGTALTLEAGGTRAVIDAATGMLTTLEIGGVSTLDSPMSCVVHNLTGEGYEFKGGFAVGYEIPGDPKAPTILPQWGDPIASSVCLVSSNMAPAMRELIFELNTPGGPAMALVYRLHASGELDIHLEGLPWEGTSPWLNNAAKITLPLAGESTSFPYLEDRFAFYGFKAYQASVHQAARSWKRDGVGWLELGEDAVNGRFWTRRFIPVADTPEITLELADEGLIVKIQPVAAEVLAVALAGESGPAMEPLRKALDAVGLTGAGDAVTLESVITPDLGPGNYTLTRAGDGKITLRAGDVFGLHSAAFAISRHLSQGRRSIPLTASSPIAPIRATGPGGGNFEVDFPYESEEEWKRVLGNCMDSGMNTIACLGMWCNWKMPVSFKYMPELLSTEPDAFDESSGAKMAEVDMHRERGQSIARFVQERGGKIWLWLPIGCIPTTFPGKYPDAMAPAEGGGHSPKIPCFTHPDYKRYIEAYLKELIETYKLDGMVMIRDDNGGLCACDRCKEYVAASRTKDSAWEQYLVIYEWLRNNSFTGDIAIYPYNDPYKPALEALLPEDIQIVGHGGECAVLSRDMANVGVMGDTWLDNIYANFRIPPAARMKRLLGDRPSFWLGGAYNGAELPWEAIGYFGANPAATPNSLRYTWGQRELGPDAALPYVAFSQVYEKLWEMNARYMPPGVWMRLSTEERESLLRDGMVLTALVREKLDALKKASDVAAHERWFEQVDLFAPFMEYHLNRLALFASVYDAVLPLRDSIASGQPLPADVRASVLDKYAEMYEWAALYATAMNSAPANVQPDCRWMIAPYKEWMAGYDQWLDWRLDMKQFQGTMEVNAPVLSPGQPFTLEIRLRNTGVCPWVIGAGQRLEFGKDATIYGLPEVWDYDGPPMAPGDERTIVFTGTTPATPAEATFEVAFTSPFRSDKQFLKATVALASK